MSSKNNRTILRKNLICLLDDLSDKGIIYLNAPAGYGKTVFVRQWLERSNHKYAFISLDEYDNDPLQLCTRFCAALLNCQPENELLHKIIMTPSFDIAPDEFTFRAITALSSDDNTLVIDDLHFVHNERALHLLLDFLKQLPESFNIILVSRNELPSGYSDLCLNCAFAQITADKLRFSSQEIMLLYEKHGYSITPKMADEILKFTDGWAIGIGALLLSCGNPDAWASGSRSERLAPQGENIKYLDEFIYANIWQQWDKTTHEFILKTAIVREMTPPLCAAITDEPNCEKLLEQLIQQGVFISRTEQGAYRYHGLFHDFLRSMLKRRGDVFYSAMLEKAGHWYLSENDFYNAADCFIKSENHDGIIKCFTLLINIGHQDFIIEKLIPIINSSMIRTVAELYPYIYSLLSWAAFNQGNAADFTYYCDQYYKHHPDIARADPRFALNIVFVSMTDFRNKLRELFPAFFKELSALITTYPSALEIKAGTINQNMPLIHRGTRDLSEFIGYDVSDTGKLKDALGLAFGEESGLLFECVKAGLLYERGHWEEAYCYASAANAKIRKHFSSESKFFTMATLSLILDALKQHEQAEEVVKNIADMIEQDSAYSLSYNFRALLVRRKLRKGDVKAANDWLKEHEPPTHDRLDFYKLYRHLTTCRAFIINGDYDSAIILLKKVLALVTAYNRPLDIIEANILLSIAYWNKKRGFQSAAMKYLEQAVLMAYSYGYTQLFINEGVELADMLRQLQTSAQWQSGETAPTAEFIKTLTLYLEVPKCQKSGTVSGKSTESIKYTDKQRMVMRLLCEGKSYNEIAEIMEVRISTLRSHIAVIYRKLDVTNETEAVVKIKALGIFAGNE